MAALIPYEQGRRNQAANAVHTNHTADREYVRGLAEQRGVSIDAELAREPSPWRDNGPYASAQQARAQVDAVTFGIPGDPDELTARIALTEALLLAGLTLDNTTEYECQVRDDLAHRLDPATAQVIAGWIIRAYLGGVVGDAAVSPRRSEHHG